MKRSFIAVVLIMLLAVPYFAGEKANFILAEKFSTDNLRKMVGDFTVNPHWLHKSDKFWYSYKTSTGTKYYLVDPAQKKRSRLFDNNAMTEKLVAITNKSYNPHDLPIKKIEFKENNREFTFELEKQKFLYDISLQQLTFLEKLDKKAKDESWKLESPDKKWIVFAQNHDLFLVPADKPDSAGIKLTSNGEKFFSYSRRDDQDKKDERTASRAVWFKDSQKIYVLRSDRRKVEDLFLVHSMSQPRPTLETYKYSMPGDKNLAQPELSIIDITSQKQVVINAAKWQDQAISPIREQGKGSAKIWFTRRDRTWAKMDLCVADTATGTITVLISEESRPYFHTRLAQCKLVNDGQEFIWWSERDNWGHFYLYDGAGKLKNRITQGPFHANRVLEVDEKNRVLYFLAYGKEKDRDPYYNHYYRINLDGRGQRLLTPEDATHSFAMTESMQYFVDTFSRVDLAPVSVLRDNLGNVVLPLETMDTSRLEQVGWKPPEVFKVKAADDVTDLYGVMWKPFDFDPQKKYPVIVYCYPGPQSEPVPKTFLLLRDQRVHNVPLAQLGFIVVSVGQRGGSPLRSKWYHTYGYGNARDYPLADNKYAVEQLARRFAYMDAGRVGIYGRSGGGFMSAAALLVYPDFYTAAFSSCGNHDNLIYNHSWGELHYGIKEVEKKVKTEEGEKTETVFVPDITTNSQVAANLKGKLMLIHGEVDNNVHPANTLRLADALIKAGKRFDLMIFPGKRHAFGEYTRYIERLMWFFFAEHLKGDYRTNTDIYEPAK